jgi:formylglycine-generating enzyme required for sulfatase activity
LFVEGDGYDNSTYWTKAGWLWKRDKNEPSMFWRDRKWNFPNHPIVGVSWYEAHAFSNWLDTQYRQQALFPNLLPRTVFSEVTAYVLRLPTEAEWTRAAFGFGQQKYIYGNEFDRYKVNVEKTGIGRTSAVDLFPNGVSPFGALDMGGNVWEWCLTKWREIYRPQEQNEAEGSEKRTLRGGSWGSSEDDTRAPSRVGGVPYGAYSNQGFRVVIAKRV